MAGETMTDDAAARVERARLFRLEACPHYSKPGVTFRSRADCNNCLATFAASERTRAREEISGFTLAESAQVPEALRGDRDWWQQNAVYWRMEAQRLASERTREHAPSAEDMARVILDWRETASTLLAERDAARQEAETLRQERDAEARAGLVAAEQIASLMESLKGAWAERDSLRAALGAAQEALRRFHCASFAGYAPVEVTPADSIYRGAPCGCITCAPVRAALAAGLPPSKTDTLKETL